MQLRIGGTIKFTDRYIALSRGRSPVKIPNKGTLPPGQFAAPVEFDQLTGTFDRATRANVQATAEQGAQAFDGIAVPMQAALARAPSALDQARAVLADLGADRESLHTLVTSADSTVHAIDTADPGIAQLVSGTATTFAAVAGQNQALRDLLAELPAALSTARTTLSRADRTLRAAGGLSRRLSPGVVEVRRITPALNAMLPVFQRVGGDATSTLRTLKTAAPDLNNLLDEVRTLMPEVGSISKQAAMEVHCIRPYAPDVMAFLADWSAGFAASSDGKDHYLRAELGTFPFPNASPLNSEQVAKTFTGMHSVLPFPPGYGSGHPWFIPECKLGPETVDPAKDPENKTGLPMYPKKFLAENPALRGDTGTGGKYDPPWNGKP
ncbi:MAG: Mammalian cell entry related domain protein [Solirubrobacterales bacterium]|nr:Mammalian cell entry related domain protein [Solirubrobacterales bacterium]